MPKNFERMVRLAEEFFATKDDPEQLSVTEEVMDTLKQIHHATITEERNDDGPVAWILLIPTTADLMERFIRKELNERELLDATPRNAAYQSVYLCSALVLPEFRRKGIAKRLVLRAIRLIQQDHPISALFVWAFSAGGDALARQVAGELGLPLRVRSS